MRSWRPVRRRGTGAIQTGEGVAGRRGPDQRTVDRNMTVGRLPRGVRPTTPVLPTPVVTSKRAVLAIDNRIGARTRGLPLQPGAGLGSVPVTSVGDGAHRRCEANLILWLNLAATLVFGLSGGLGSAGPVGCVRGAGARRCRLVWDRPRRSSLAPSPASAAASCATCCSARCRPYCAASCTPSPLSGEQPSSPSLMKRAATTHLRAGRRRSLPAGASHRPSLPDRHPERAQRAPPRRP